MIYYYLLAFGFVIINYLQYVDTETKDIKKARDLMQAGRQTKCMLCDNRLLGN